MSAFDTYEESLESSEPVEFYQFIVGSTTYRYNDSEETITISGNDWEPLAISRSRIVRSQDRDRKGITVRMPGHLEIPSLFVDSAPTDRISFSLYLGQRNESPAWDTLVPLFPGFVKGVSWEQDGTVAVIAIRSLEDAMNGTMPRVSYKSLCNNFLYDDLCGVNPASFSHVGNVSSISGNDITISGINASGIDFVGGYVQTSTGTDFRLVLAQSGDTLTLLLPFFTDPTGSNVTAFAGCDHKIDGDCALVFDNVAEFNGFAFVPNRDPYRSGLD